MRLFVAITPPPAVLDELEARVAALRPEWPALRWTGRPAWHITLAFLGEVSEQTSAALGPRLERAAHRHPSLPVSLAGAGAFPGPRHARVLWTGISSDRRALEALAGYAGTPWTAAEIHLIRSHPGDRGSKPHYETVGTWPLR